MADKLKPGKYLIGPGGVVHGFHEGMATQPGVRVLVVDGQGREQDQGVLTAPTLRQKLVKVMREMPMLESNIDLYTAGGVPRTDWLSEQVGEVINAKLRDEAWEEVRPIDVILGQAAA